MKVEDNPVLFSEVIETVRDANKQIEDGESSNGGSSGNPVNSEKKKQMEKSENQEKPENQENSDNPENSDSDMFKENGEFLDEELEKDYQKYVKRKNREGKTPRDRKDWKETRDYWLNDSPMARGNAFNKKARKERWYPCCELNLEDGTRLDGYHPVKGEIVSRKATDLENISIETYETYLKELKYKYPPGKKIRSNAYPELDGQELKGKQILEIPDSNEQFSEIEKYKEIAHNYGIELRFRKE